jgi:hypothetical protein
MLTLEKNYFESELYIPGACRLAEDRITYLLDNLDNRYIRSIDVNGEISLKVYPEPITVAKYGSEINLSIHQSFENYMQASKEQYFPELFSTELKSIAYFVKNPNNSNSINKLKYNYWHRSQVGEHNMIVKLAGSRSLWIAVPEDPNSQDSYQIVRRVNNSCELESRLSRFFEL